MEKIFWHFFEQKRVPSLKSGKFFFVFALGFLFICSFGLYIPPHRPPPLPFTNGGEEKLCACVCGALPSRETKQTASIAFALTSLT